MSAATRTPDGVLNQPLTRLEPFDGLVIDAASWAVAHGYHTASHRLHNLAAHGAGVLVGLEVVPTGGRAVGVLPGVGLAPNGTVFVLPTPTRVPVDGAGGATAFIVLRPTTDIPDDDGRVREGAEVQAVAALPAEPHLELARVILGGAADIRHPVDPRRPHQDEIDPRFRLVAGGHARGTIEIAELPLPGAGTGHVGGAALVTRAVTTDGAYRARYLGEIRAGGMPPAGGVIYLTGDAEFTVNEGTAAWLRAFLDSGGTLLGDGCHATAADPFGGAFDRLAKAVGRQLRRVVDGDRLLWSHHAFGAPPPGAVKTDVGLVLTAGGVIYCASDYGCVLRGGKDGPIPRPAIQAVEQFCTNIIALARERALPLGG